MGVIPGGVDPAPLRSPKASDGRMVGYTELNDTADADLGQRPPPPPRLMRRGNKLLAAQGADLEDPAFSDHVVHRWRRRDGQALVPAAWIPPEAD